MVSPGIGTWISYFFFFFFVVGNLFFQPRKGKRRKKYGHISERLQKRPKPPGRRTPQIPETLLGRLPFRTPCSRGRDALGSSRWGWDARGLTQVCGRVTHSLTVVFPPGGMNCESG